MCVTVMLHLFPSAWKLHMKLYIPSHTKFGSSGYVVLEKMFETAEIWLTWVKGQRTIFAWEPESRCFLSSSLLSNTLEFMHIYYCTYCVNISNKYMHEFEGLTSEKQSRSSTIQDKAGKCLTEEKEILSRWTEYCSELYNYESCWDNTVLDCSQPPKEALQPILREEVEIAVASLKKGKSAGVDNIPAELVQAGGETMIDVLTEICNRIWRTGEWPTQWTQSLIITLPKKGNLQLCQNYRTISLISHSSKVMLKVILNRLKPQA